MPLILALSRGCTFSSYPKGVFASVQLVYMYDEGVCYIFIISIIQWNIFTAQNLGMGFFCGNFFVRQIFGF